jgi:hypothetical protein
MDRIRNSTRDYQHQGVTQNGQRSACCTLVELIIAHSGGSMKYEATIRLRHQSLFSIHPNASPMS